MDSIVELETEFFVSQAWIQQLLVVVWDEGEFKFFPSRYFPSTSDLSWEKLFDMWKTVHQDFIVLEYFTTKKLYISRKALFNLCTVYKECWRSQGNGSSLMVMEFEVTRVSIPFDCKTFSSLLSAWKEAVNGTALVDLMN